MTSFLKINRLRRKIQYNNWLEQGRRKQTKGGGAVRSCAAHEIVFWPN